MTQVNVSCSQCGTQTIDPGSSGTALVKVPGQVIAVIYQCPKCSEMRRQEVHPSLIGTVTLVFRSAGRPLVFLPPQGDLPWPPLSSDDLIEWGLHADEILEELTSGGLDD